MNTSAILDSLNEAQREAVQHGDGPLLILAGAGSGKTRVLTHRIAYLVQARGVPPQAILAVTFTNKAAAEMASRVESLLGHRAGVWVSTFHALCVRILRQDGGLLPVGANITILDSADQLALMRECLKELNLDAKRFEPRNLLSAISRAKNELQTVDDLGNGRNRASFSVPVEVLANAWRRYQEKLIVNHACDFDDLLFWVVELFREHPEVLQRYQERWRYILVDEYQDTNRAQYVLVQLLARRYRNICVVGDDNQSIYAWRGADIRNILDFEKDYPDCKVVKLEQNYRSTQTILEAANHVIRHNRSRTDKELWTDRGKGHPIVVYAAPDERAEAIWVAREIMRRQSAEGRSLADFAVLYRTNAQSRSFEEALMASGVAYRVLGALRFYERREIKDILAYLRVIYNPADQLSLARIINVPKRGIGPATWEKVAALAAESGMAAADLLASHRPLPGVGAQAEKALRRLGQQLQNWRQAALALPVSQLVQQVLRESGYLALLEADQTVEGKGRVENLEEFTRLADEFSTQYGPGVEGLAALLERSALLSEADNYDENEEAVVLMTLHAAKGLEFPIVFMVGMEEGTFPLHRAADSPEEMEEERRLCYVGITRARESLYFTLARTRRIYGSQEERMPSTFLEEVPPELWVEAEGSVGLRGHEWQWTWQSGGMEGGSEGLRSPAGSGPAGYRGLEGSGMRPGRPNLRLVYSADRDVARTSRISPGSGTTGPWSGGRIRAGVPETSNPAGGQNMNTKGREADFRVGEHVTHPIFGPGVVVAVDGKGDNAVVSVVFDKKGLKRLVLGYAPLQHLDQRN
ncbi:MAG: UvrD-helicase domain-containing protein [Firmicutes bacterium]|nr:UvrD-helicase domain-containing protein [Bacillota bacterium]